MEEEITVPTDTTEAPEVIELPKVPQVQGPIPIMNYVRPVALIVLVLLADQLLKYWVKTHMELGEQRSLLGKYGYLHFTENNGIAFGLELPAPWGKLLLTIFRIVAASFIFSYLLKLIKRRVSNGLVMSGALVFAGASGNILDSIFYGVFFKNNLYQGGWFHGRVVDMLYFPIVDTHWPKWFPFVGGSQLSFFDPIFNLADASITVGILMIIIFYRRSLKEL